MKWGKTHCDTWQVVAVMIKCLSLVVVQQEGGSFYAFVPILKLVWNCIICMNVLEKNYLNVLYFVYN